MSTLDRDRMRKAVALSLAMDGYIDLFEHDGEAYIYGDDRLGARVDIESVANSLIKWYEADQEAAVAEVLTRRHREARD